MRRVIKIGGSLLRYKSLPRSLRSWLDSQPPAETFAIVGGGELIDAVRHLDETFPASPMWVHWQCVSLLRTTFEWLAVQLGDWQIESTAEQFDQLKRTFPAQTDNASYLVAVDSFYHPGVDSPLPEDWTTTTDAIAGWLSVLLDADELVLLKSCDVDPSASLADLARQGVIDAALPLLENDLPVVRFVNFTAEINR